MNWSNANEMLIECLLNQVDEPADSSSYNGAKLTHDEHCYECKVRFRDPKPKDLMMFLHAWRYKVLVDRSFSI